MDALRFWWCVFRIALARHLLGARYVLVDADAFERARRYADRAFSYARCSGRINDGAIYRAEKRLLRSAEVVSDALLRGRVEGSTRAWLLEEE